MSKLDIFDTKGIKPMLIAEMQEPFDSGDYIYEIKWDGIRSIAYLDDSYTDIRNKRDIKTLQHYPELKDINKRVNEKCILDGEVFILKNGVPDFYEVQRRSILTDPFKIQLAAKKYPATYVAFDIIYYKNKLVIDLPLMERKALLDKVLNDCSRICKSQYIEYNGIALFEASKAQNLEGIVAKRKDSQYFFDKRTKNWIKCKVMLTEDFALCGYILKPNGMTSFILGQYIGNKLIYKGHITLGASLRKLNQYHYEKIDKSPFNYIPAGNNNAVWLKPELVCEVEYMPSEKEGRRQGTCKGIRTDKLAIECQIEE